MADLKPPLSGGYSIWLESSSDERQFFQELIIRLADRYGGQHFSPHVTLLSLPTWQEDRLEEAQYLLDDLTDNVGPFTLELTGVGQRDRYLQSVFLHAAHTQELGMLLELTRHLCLDSMPNYMPHASLFYGDLITKDKKKLVAEIDFDFPRPHPIASVSLVWAKGWPSEWEVVSRVPLIVPTP